MKRLIGIDYGMKRVGLAVTDPICIIATPLITVKCAMLFDYLKDYLSAHPVRAFVIGMPTSSQRSPMQQAVYRLATQLKKLFPKQDIFFQDESYTSQEALTTLIKGNFPKKKRKQKANIDMVSATLILREFMAENPTYIASQQQTTSTPSK